MASHDRWWLSSRWMSLILVMTSTTAALSLTNFQPIVSSAVSLSCILAYNSPIPGCSVSDFVRESTCSAECVKGLLRTQATIQSVCSDADVSPTSILGQVLRGNLVDLVCPGTSPGAPTSTSPSRRPTATTTIFVTRSTSIPPLILTTVRPPTTTTSSAATTETDEPGEEDTSTSVPSSTSTTPPDSPIPTLIETSSSTASSAASPQSTSSTTTESAEPTDDNSSGGGSPFDLPIVSSARQLASCWVEAIFVSLAVGLMLLR